MQARSTFRFSLFLLFVVSLITTSCNHFEGDQEIPAYIQIDSIKISPSSAASFDITPSAKIVDAWITIDGISLGGYQMPTRIPVLAKGEHTVLIQAGILSNNLSLRRGIYPFYNGVEFTVNFEEAVSKNVTLKEDGSMQTMVTLRSTNKYVLKEDFEDTRTVFDTVPNFNSILPGRESCDLVPTPTSRLYYGTGVGYIHLEKGDSCCIMTKETFEGETAFPFNKPIFVEIDYLTDNAFEVGIISIDGGTSTFLSVAGAGTQKSTEWNKIYVDISNRVTAQMAGGISKFKLFIRADLDKDNTEANIYLDNVRIVFSQ